MAHDTCRSPFPEEPDRCAMLLLPQKLFSWPLVLYLFSEDPWGNVLQGLASFIPYKSLHNAYKELPSQANSLWILFFVLIQVIV